MNRWLDEHPENAHIRSPEQMLDGRINNYHPHTDKSDERYMGDGIAERLTGTHGRADVNVMTTSWEDAPSKPFRDLIANPHIVRCALRPAAPHPLPSSASCRALPPHGPLTAG